MVSLVQEQYEKWPYPSIPRVASVPQENLWQLHLNWIRSRCGIPPLKTASKIWIAGCGTFEPYLFSKANPDAQILASDISSNSLNLARKRLSWHRLKNVELRSIDLSQGENFPDQKFDLIECYGVLMCLPHPLETLKNLSSRLKPDGILRIMVYPHYSRQRIFQIQRLAKLLKLDYRNPKHPHLLKNILTHLPKNHPLHYAFSSYWDSQNLSGIIDGFLHASDRGFTGIEICSMIDEAELKPRFCFHRPWGNPSVMSQKLSALGERNFAFWLHYLDLWQSIRSNFILCLTKKDLGTIEHFNPDRHPLFDLSNPKLSLFQKAKLVRYSITGAQLPSRTNESALKLSSKAMSELIWKKAEPKLETSPIDIRLHNEKWNTEFDLRLNQLIPQKHFILRQGKRILNPLYDYLFDTYTFDQSFNYLFPNSLPDLEAQIQIWENEAFPLETQNISWGLTPYGTFKVQQENILPIKESYLSAPEISFDDFALPRESKNFNQVHHFLKSFSHSSFGEFSLSELRQLWILLFSQNQFFID